MAVSGDKAEKQLREITECPICMSTFTDPRMLQCIHTFCFECLKSTGEAEKKKPGDKMCCPLCRREFIIPLEGIFGLQRNFFMENFLEYKATLQSNPTILKVGTDTQEEVKRMSNVKRCNQHYEKLLEYYCAECKIVVCVSCFVESHKLHDCKDVATVEENVRQTISRAALKASNYADEMLSLRENADMIKTDFLMKLQKIETTIIERNKDLKDLIDKHTNSLLDELTAIKSKIQKEMETRLEEIDRCYTILSSFETYCTEITLQGSASDICSSFDQLIVRAEELEKDHKAFLGRSNISVEVTFQTTDAGDVLQNANENLIGHVKDCSRLPSDEMNAHTKSSHQMDAQTTSSDQTLRQKSSSDPIHGDNRKHGADKICIECDVCKEGDPDDTHLPTASKRCTECQQNLCSRCINDHRRQKLLKHHQIVDFTCWNRESIPEVGQDSSNVFPSYLSTNQIQHQISGTNVLAEIERERDRHTEYEKEMSDHIDQLVKRQDDTKKTANDIWKMIMEKFSECLARLERDKDCLLWQFNSQKEKLLSDNEIKLYEAMSYLEEIRNHRMKFETQSLQQRLTEVDIVSDRSLLLHVHFQRQIQSSLDNVSFHKSLACTENDNIIGRLEGLTNIRKIQTAPTLEGYMKFLRNVHNRTTDARRLHWKLNMLNEAEMKALYELNFLQGVYDELELSIHVADKKRDELQKRHTRLAIFLFEVTRPTSESSSEKYESHLLELQHITEEMWNMIQFQIHYKNSDKGLKPEGFQNFGNTCYFNSVCQCLVQTILLPFELTLNLYGLGNVLTNKEEMSCLNRAFMEMTSNYKVSKQRKETLKALYDKFKVATPRFNDQKLHDSHDLLTNFLDKLRIEERNARHKSETQKTLTAVDRIFGGHFITVYTCHSCKDSYAIRDPFLDISIPDKKEPEDYRSRPKNQEMFEMPYPTTPDIAKNRREVIKNMLQPIAVELSAEPEVTKGFFGFSKKSNLNVSQCLKYFSRAKEIKDEYLCRNCQSPGSDVLKMTSATKHTLISSPPAVLVLHLKRFEQRSTEFAKNDEMISYDELLDLGPFCSSSALRINPEEENVWYSLYGVVVHSGLSLSKGHYVACVKQRDSSVLLDDQLREKFLQKTLVVGHDCVPNDDDLETLKKRKAIKKRDKAKPPNPIPGQWFYIRDDYVCPCAVKEALSQKAYLLFYERIPGTDEKSMGV